MSLSKSELMQIYEEMVLIRRFEEKIDELISMAKITGTTHLGIGQEAIMTGTHHALDKDDYSSSTHRDHGFILIRSGKIKEMMAELHGREAGLSKGWGGSTHMMDLDSRNFGNTGIIGAAVPIAAGVALALKMRRSKQIMFCGTGDGALNNGATCEGLNMAAIWKLPIVYLCQNNQYAMSTPLSKAFAIDDLSKRAEAFGMFGTRIDGNDVHQVYEAVKTAANHARNGKGPTLIVAETYRYRGHSKSDMQKYRKKDEVDEWKRTKDPIMRVEIELKLSEVQIATVDKTVSDSIDEAVAYAEKCPFAPASTIMDYVYFEEDI